MAGVLPITYASHAGFLLVAGYYPTRVVDQALSKALLFWAHYENIELARPLRQTTLKEFARVFRKHIHLDESGQFDMTQDEANAAALSAVREWWEPYRCLADLM